MCDSRTAVSLARANCDPRWFIPPKLYGVLKSPKDITDDIRNLLKQLKPNKCVDYILRTLFDTKIKEPDDYYLKFIRYDTQLMQQCLEAILHLTNTKDICNDILANKGLEILLEIEKICKDDINMKIILSKIISNLSICPNSNWHFYVSGWLHILSRWRSSNDMRLNVTAGVALTNLDSDDPNRYFYGPNLFLLYPSVRSPMKPEVDIVFIHGLLGNIVVFNINVNKY